MNAFLENLNSKSYPCKTIRVTLGKGFFGRDFCSNQYPFAASVARITLNFNVESPPSRARVYLADGTALWRMQVSDCHWFRLSESPTNMIFFPLNLAKKSWPSNLRDQIPSQGY